jgi:creatinine amidohydrolase/Fe(II)-dependent formamide hydrolase-like protein
MTGARPSRVFAELTFQEAARALRDSSILCLPLGAIEQHGPHLPLNTDVIVAEGVTSRIIARWGDPFDLWQLPTLSVGLSREHDWAPGTLSLSIGGFVRYLRDLAREIARSLPTRNLAIINGHGGNRGILEALLHELKAECGITACVLHPFDLAGGDPQGFDIHGGKGETSVMLALAPELVRAELITAGEAPDPDTLRELIIARGTTWAWRTDDPRLARNGVVGDASSASAEFGHVLIERMIERSGVVFRRLLEHSAR